MNNYNEMLKELVMDARALLDKADGVQNKFNMSVELIKAIVEVAKLEQPVVVQAPVQQVSAVKEEIIEEPEEEPEEVQDEEPCFSDSKPLSKEHYRKFMFDNAGFIPSDKCYEEYCILWERRGTEDALNEFIPDNLGLNPIPEGAYVPLSIKECPMYKELFMPGGAYADYVNPVNLFEDEETELNSAPKSEEEIEVEIDNEEVEVVEEPEVEIDDEEVEEEMPTDITPEVAGGEVVDELQAIKDKVANMSLDESTEFLSNLPDETMRALVTEDPTPVIAEYVMTPDGEVTRVDVPENIFIEIEGEQYDATDAYKFIKGLNAELSHEELLERASDFVEFAIDEEVYNKLTTIEDENTDLILCKTYLAYYIQALTEETVLYYLNYFACNIEDDENGEEVYINDEVLLDFLNKDNIEAFVEYIQINQQ